MPSRLVPVVILPLHLEIAFFAIYIRSRVHLFFRYRLWLRRASSPFHFILLLPGLLYIYAMAFLFLSLIQFHLLKLLTHQPPSWRLHFTNDAHIIRIQFWIRCLNTKHHYNKMLIQTVKVFIHNYEKPYSCRAQQWQHQMNINSTTEAQKQSN